MHLRRGLLFALLVTFFSVVTSAGATPRRRVTRIHIDKSEHTMELLAGEDVVASYRVAIGPGGAGPKKQEGDQITPVGRYHVVSKSPSRYRFFLGLDYPNAEDRARFARLKREGELPPAATIGGAIGIHGPPVSMPEEDKSALKQVDWTLGCIAVHDDEIRQIARLVAVGTPVDIDD